MRPAALCLLPALCALPTLAGFTPAQCVQQVKLAYGQKDATVIFETTDGSTISDAEPLCDCTTVRAEGRRLVAQVDTSAFDAPVDKQIEVRTSDGAKSTLTMRFAVPLALELNTPSLVWKRGEALRAQEFRIRIPKGSPVRALLQADISGDDFDYKAETLTPGREYRVTVTPKSTAKRRLNRLVIRMDSAEPRFSQRILYLQVK